MHNNSVQSLFFLTLIQFHLSLVGAYLSCILGVCLKVCQSLQTLPESDSQPFSSGLKQVYYQMLDSFFSPYQPAQASEARGPSPGLARMLQGSSQSCPTHCCVSPEGLCHCFQDGVCLWEFLLTHRPPILGLLILLKIVPTTTESSAVTEATEQIYTRVLARLLYTTLNLSPGSGVRFACNSEVLRGPTEGKL